VDLAAHRLLDRLARLDEARQRREHRGREAVAASEQAARSAHHHGDGHRVGAREMLCRAGDATAVGARALGHGRAAAHRAEAVAGVPVQERARLGGDGRLARVEACGHGAQILEGGDLGEPEGGERVGLVGDVHGEVGHAVAQAEQHRRGRGVEPVEERPGRPRQRAGLGALHEWLEPPQGEEARRRVGAQRFQPGRIAPLDAHPVERAPGERDRFGHR